ncbi:MAG TPA: hypothetical protein ENG62_02835, partial [Thermoplasmatales archaeon]|nr:hypothetical protein [Thermoplasmatales archaeon]
MRRWYLRIPLVCLVILLIFNPLLNMSGAIEYRGFDKGVSWEPTLSLRKITFVGYDSNSLLDDYAFLSAIPTAVFYDKEFHRLVVHPLLYFEEEKSFDRLRERSMNTYQGIKYFMEDWMGCVSKLDEVTLINISKSNLNPEWKSVKIREIIGNTSYEVASRIALSEWEYSEDAVVAVIKENYNPPSNLIIGKLKGVIQPLEVKKLHFEVPQTNEVYPVYNEFNVPEGYKLLKVRSWYPCFYFEAGIPGFEGLINMSIPAGDRDIQVYCNEDGRWMMAGITNAWNAKQGMDTDKTSVYVYKPGRWSVALTDVPTKPLDIIKPSWNSRDTGLEVQRHHSFLLFHFGRYGRIMDIIRNMRQVIYQVDVEMYPG